MFRVNLLERHGLMGVVRTRQVAAMTGKRYQVTARTFRAGAAGLDAFAVAVLGITNLTSRLAINARHRGEHAGGVEHDLAIVPHSAEERRVSREVGASGSEVGTRPSETAACRPSGADARPFPVCFPHLPGDFQPKHQLCGRPRKAAI